MKHCILFVLCFCAAYFSQAQIMDGMRGAQVDDIKPYGSGNSNRYNSIRTPQPTIAIIGEETKIFTRKEANNSLSYQGSKSEAISIIFHDDNSFVVIIMPAYSQQNIGCLCDKMPNEYIWECQTTDSYREPIVIWIDESDEGDEIVIEIGAKKDWKGDLYYSLMYSSKITHSGKL